MIKQLINIALAEVGYQEKKNNSSLDNKTTNVGNKNYTKYARDMMKYNAGIYVNGYAWCDTFVDWCFMKAFGADKAKELLGGWSAYTPTSAGYYKQRGLWHKSNPIPGDQIFFYNSSLKEICHTGLVYKVDNKYVYTIEGNTSSSQGVVDNGGCVAKKQYLINYNRIAGFGRPRYPQEKEEIEMKEKIYDTISACPEWSKPYIQKTLDLGWIKGEGNGKLGLTDTKIWCLVVLLRAQNIMK
jgi:hypothetical protein